MKHELDLGDMLVRDAEEMLGKIGKALVVVDAEDNGAARFLHAVQSMPVTRRHAQPVLPTRRSPGRPRGKKERKSRNRIDMAELRRVMDDPDFTATGAAADMRVSPSAIRAAVHRLRQAKPKRRSTPAQTRARRANIEKGRQARAAKRAAAASAS